MFDYKDASNNSRQEILEHPPMCPFCDSETAERCDDDCPSHLSHMVALVASVKELLLATESLYKRVAFDLPMDIRFQIEDTISTVIQQMKGLK